jgi:hypothetical protein
MRWVEVVLTTALAVLVCIALGLYIINLISRGLL